MNKDVVLLISLCFHAKCMALDRPCLLAALVVILLWHHVHNSAYQPFFPVYLQEFSFEPLGLDW